MSALLSLRSLQPPAIVFAAMPKSASQTLLARLEHMFGGRTITPKSGGGIGHLIIDAAQLGQARACILSRSTPLIYQHFLPTEKNRSLLKAHLNTPETPRVIVSVRNIHDALSSARAHERNHDYGPFWIDRRAGEFYAGDEGAHCLYWHAVTLIEFYAAWAIAEKLGTWSVKFIRHEEILNTPAECLRGIGEFFGIPPRRTPEDGELAAISRNISPDKTERPALPARILDLVHDYARTFRDIDFSPIGLGRDALAPAGKEPSAAVPPAVPFKTAMNT
jgi:hypothetical protein